MSTYAWNNRLVRIDLANKDIKNEEINSQHARQYVGGRGFATKILYDEGVAKAEPLSEDNKLILMTGPLTGAQAPTTGRWMAVTKSPANNCINSTNSGGTWGAKLKQAGIDGIILEDKSEDKVYILIENSEVSIHPADELWGKDIEEITDFMEEKYPGSVTMGIGIAGENMSPMAALINDRNRAAGRGGAGAVMGSKNVKAVVVVPDENKFDEIYDSEELKAANRRALEIIRENPTTSSALREYGTAVLVNIINAVGALPTKNWQYVDTERAEAISGEAMTETILSRASGCYRCPITCERRIEVDSINDGEEIGGPEYETIWAYGSGAEVYDLDAISQANAICDQHGLDSISTPMTISAAMELYEKGIITDEDCDGVPLEYGSSEAIVKWTEKIAKQDCDLAKLMAQGSLALCQHYDVEEYSMTVKGLEMPAYDGRAIQGIGLNYATSNRGADHCKGYTIGSEILGDVDRTLVKGKGKLVKDTQDLTAVIDSLGLCLFTSFALGAQEYRDLFYAATGYDLTVEELMETGERIYNIERMFNKEAGVKGEDDTLPKRLTHEPIPNGPSKGMVSHLDVMLPEYYEARGWIDGYPTEDTLERLNI